MLKMWNYFGNKRLNGVSQFSVSDLFSVRMKRGILYEQ